MKFIKSFTRFLWDFFIGDMPELFLGACGVVILAWFTHRFAGSITPYSLPASIAVVMSWSLLRARRR